MVQLYHVAVKTLHALSLLYSVIFVRDIHLHPLIPDCRECVICVREGVIVVPIVNVGHLIRWFCLMGWLGGWSPWSGDMTGSGGLIGVTLMKLPDEVVIQYVSGGDPGSLLWAISLPVHKVLDTPPLSAGLQETADSVGEASVDEMRRWRRWDGGDQGTLSDQLDFGDVECRVDAHGSGEFESHCCWVDDLDNLEGANKTRGQLP